MQIPTSRVNLLKTNEDDVFEISQRFLANNHTGLFKQGDAIEAVMNIRKNPKFAELGLTDDLLMKIKGVKGVAYSVVINNLDNFGKKVAEKEIILTDFSKLLAELTESEAKRDGANWIVKYLGDHANDFAGKKLKFEHYESNSLGGRYVDVLDNTIEQAYVYFEFKSVASVPPTDFAEQFMKDLTNANSLDQIKWIFNGSKNPPNFRQNMLDAIDGLSLNDNLAKKYLNNPDAEIDDLRSLLRTKIDEIFILK